MSHATGNEDVSGGAGQAAEPDEQNLGSLGDAGHTFDQTNGLVDGLQGNSDGFAAPDDITVRVYDDSGILIAETQETIAWTHSSDPCGGPSTAPPVVVAP